MREDFDPDALHRMIDDVLGEGDHLPPPPASSRLPFGLGDSKLFEELHELLPKYMHAADGQVVLDELRSRYFEGLHKVSLQEMHTITKHCRRCPEVEPAPQLPQGNLAHPDVVFVGENLATTNTEYLYEVSGKVGFSLRHTAVTAVTRCPIPGRQPNNLEIENCTNYLFTELQVLLPKLIVPMGNTASSVFLGTIKITEDHGRIFWIGPWAVMPIMAPSHVLARDLDDVFLADMTRAYSFCYGT